MLDDLWEIGSRCLKVVIQHPDLQFLRILVLRQYHLCCLLWKISTRLKYGDTLHVFDVSVEMFVVKKLVDINICFGVVANVLLALIFS